MRIAWLLISVWMSALCAREIIWIDGGKGNLFQYDQSLQYYELNIWQKIAYMLSKYDVTIHSEETIDIRDRSRRELGQAFGKNRQLLFVEYRGHYPRIKDMRKLPREGVMNIMFEPPAVFATSYSPECYDLFSKIFTFHDGLVDGKKFIKYRYFNLSTMIENLIPFQERKLCSGFFGNKSSNYSGELYTERRRAIAFFERNHLEDFDFYGPGWDKNKFPSYCGAVDNKCDVMRHYKFAIAYENTRDVPGYVTEKIFDCFQAGVVPIYLGSPTIDREIPRGCFIDYRDFSSYEELYAYLFLMGEDEFNVYLENIRTFLASPQAKLFDQDHFVLAIVNGICGAELTVNDL